MSAGLAYGEDQALLRDEVRRWLGERCSIEAVRALLGDARGDDPGVWKELGELGWLGLSIPEEYGGAGLGAVDLAVLAEETGRALLPTPLLSHTLAAVAIARGGSEQQCSEWLPQLATGELRATLAHVEPDGCWRAEDTRARSEGGRLHGEKHFVWAGASADLFCVPVRAGADVKLALVPANAAGVSTESEKTLDATRRQARLRLDGVQIPDSNVLERPAAEVELGLLPLAWTAVAAESVGGAGAVLDLTAAYAATREQFGKAIGSFQAIKHPLVNVLIGVEQAKSLAYAAASAIDQNEADAALLARMAKAAAGDAFAFAGSRAIQFHGGYGFTEDCDAHLYLRRAQSSRAVFGDPSHHRGRIATELLGPAD
jgi:alkylation response protein AidB-like acyl-CoA dehydrogenase